MKVGVLGLAWVGLCESALREVDSVPILGAEVATVVPNGKGGRSMLTSIGDSSSKDNWTQNPLFCFSRT
jgi:hypothetical protein